jgi:hypothetical protein
MTRKISDSVIDEIHRTREEISERFNGNINAIAEDAAHRQAASTCLVWKPKIPNKSLQSGARLHIRSTESAEPVVRLQRVTDR